MNRLRRKNSDRRNPSPSVMLRLLLVCAFLTAPAVAADKPEYLPPIPPQIDRSPVDQRAPKDAAPSQGDVKDLLLQALNRHNAGDSAGAERLFRKALAVDPNNADANFNLGTLAEQNHDWVSALRYYNAAAKANPSDPDVKAALAEVQHHMRQLLHGNETADAIANRDRLRTMGQAAAAAYKDGKFDQAINQLRAIEREQPNDPGTQFALGQAYRAAGDTNSAIQHFSKAVALEPQNKLFANALHDVRKPSGIRWTPDSTPAPSPAANRGFGTTASGQHPHPQKNASDWVEDDDETASTQKDSAIGWQTARSGSHQTGAGSGLQPFTAQGQEQLQGYSAQNAGTIGGGVLSPGMGQDASGVATGSIIMGSGIMGGGMLNGGMMGMPIGTLNGGMMGGSFLNGGMMGGGLLNGGMTGMPIGMPYGNFTSTYRYSTLSPYGFPSASPYGYGAPAYGYGRGYGGGLRHF